MGGVVKGIGSAVGGSISPTGTSTDAQVAKLTKIVQLLCQEGAALEALMQITPEGLSIKVGMSELHMQKTGGITMSSQRIRFKTPTKDENSV